MIRETETLDKLYLEWSQFTNARTAREMTIKADVGACISKLIKLNAVLMNGHLGELINDLINIEYSI